MYRRDLCQRTGPRQRRTSKRRESSTSRVRPVTERSAVPTQASQTGDKPLVSTRVQAASPAPLTNPDPASGTGRLAKARPQVHRHTAAAISKALGFTVPARNNTIGDTATATPVTSHLI